MTKRKRSWSYNQKYDANGIKWTISNSYQDIDTGEILRQYVATNKHLYYKIKTQKNGTVFNQPKTAATIFTTTFVRRNPQGTLPFNNM